MAAVKTKCADLTRKQPLQKEEEEFTARQMDPRLKTAGSFMDRGREDDTERKDRKDGGQSKGQM